MNTKNYQKLVKTFAAILTAAFIFLFLIGSGLAATVGVVKYASTNLSNFLPILFNRPSAETVTPSGPLFVFSSVATTDGNAGGRSGMNDICASEDIESRFCSLSEIEYAWLEKGVVFDSDFSGAWVDTPTLGTVMKFLATGEDTLSTWGRDYTCGGWTSTVGWSMYIYEGGSALNWEGADGTPIYCSEFHSVACCK